MIVSYGAKKKQQNKKYMTTSELITCNNAQKLAKALANLL